MTVSTRFPLLRAIRKLTNFETVVVEFGHLSNYKSEALDFVRVVYKNIDACVNVTLGPSEETRVLGISYSRVYRLTYHPQSYVSSKEVALVSGSDLSLAALSL